MGKVCCAQGCSEQADTNPRTGSRWNRAVCWRCHTANKAATERERVLKRRRDSLMAVSAPNEPDDLDDLGTQEWTEVDEVEAREEGERFGRGRCSNRSATSTYPT